MRIPTCQFGVILLLPVSLVAARAAEPATAINLQNGWFIQSSARVKEPGEALSNPQFSPTGWYPASVPTTVVGALTTDKLYPDPGFGMNLRSIPGTSYPIGENFSNLPMPGDSPFRLGWWYQTRFKLPADYQAKQVWLHFDGINYRATIWLDGRKIAGPDQVTGMWRLYEFNVTRSVRPGEDNALAVEVTPPNPDDLGITWVDWNPAPPDKDMGLWRPVFFTATGPVELRHPQVVTRLDLPQLETAHLTVSVELTNATDRAVKGTLEGKIEAIEFHREVSLEARQTKAFTFSPREFPQLNLSHPRLWWPREMGAQNLYDLDLAFETGGETSDRQKVRFGVREVTSEINPHGGQEFKINGRKILIRGGGWSPDFLLRTNPERLEWEIRYALDMHLNAIRLEGKIEADRFFDLCDLYGILVQAGWCCCDHWEKWRSWKSEDYTVAADSLRDQVCRLRNHPAVFDWLYGSDNPPPPRVEQMYLKVLKETHWPNPAQSSATARPTRVTGRTGLKMTGPYEWVPPNYWLLDKQHGGAYGYNTETSPGPAVPPVASLKQMLPADHLWPIDDYWNYHAGGGEFKDLKVFTAALERRYGQASGLEDYAEKSQLMTYEGERAMFEAYGRNKYVSTGVIQWMLNNAWPSLIWHLFDFYLRPAGGYFGTKKACEPIHIQYSYDDRSVVVVNSPARAYSDLVAKAEVLNFDLTRKFSKEAKLDIHADGVRRVFTLPEIEGLSPTYFLRLTLRDATGNLKSSNFYWLSTTPDVPNWKKTKWYFTPAKSYADFTALASLPKVSIKLSASTQAVGGENTTRASVENPTNHLAFFVHLRVTRGADGGEVLPALWEDNYFELVPGEKREVTASYAKASLGGAQAYVAVDGWNVTPASSPAGGE